jgi:hypothetical protein
VGSTFAEVAPSAGPVATESFAYTGSLNDQNGGSGFFNAWTAVSGLASPALTSGSMTYTDGTKSLATAGNKLQPTSASRSIRNFATQTATTSATYWVAFRANQTDAGAVPSNHAGFSLFSGADAGGTEIFLGKPGAATNWGIDHSGTMVQRPGGVETTGGRDALLVYKLVFSSGSVTISMWVNPILNESSLGTPHATLTKAHSTSIASLRFSTGTNSVNYQFDEFRFGSTFGSVTPTQ